ncbi:putative membrane protein YphA (DoxX/SURF4 family) [Microbacterium sp. W4I4]|uniref:hypothetical protein n=1 Tax=Microbacterium sp. W4I4 TaxID=3042295 RepID=UPI002787A724|nr:hypothetical protein [Microbacterium sp. W4I4]MDQ0614238.1 putative membrane protein YphA (DoxX/SURF4 family) [Microbacterium sp. W4I4]
MSTDESGGSADSARRFSWPMSRVNTVLVAACTVGALVCFVLGQVPAGVALLVGALVGGLGAVFARRGSSGDLERVNALEYADERDRAAAVRGLAVVGALALLLGVVQMIVFAIAQVDPLSRFVALGVFLALVAGWFFANWYFVRRG